MAEPSVNPDRLKGKVAVITGAAQGVGREAALLLTNCGIDGVVLADK
jgi:NAD(P)-dependent dehydrogenase (short-subunit alcohol dehydrogenase family)